MTNGKANRLEKVDKKAREAIRLIKVKSETKLAKAWQLRWNWKLKLGIGNRKLNWKLDRGIE